MNIDQIEAEKRRENAREFARQKMDWDDPAARGALAEQLGPDGYNKAFAEHRKQSIIATVNGHDIWPVQTRFGRLFVVGGTDRAFHNIEEARDFAGQS